MDRLCPLSLNVLHVFPALLTIPSNVTMIFVWMKSPSVRLISNVQHLLPSDAGVEIVVAVLMTVLAPSTVLLNCLFSVRTVAVIKIANNAKQSLKPWAPALMDIFDVPMDHAHLLNHCVLLSLPALMTTTFLNVGMDGVSPLLINVLVPMAEVARARVKTHLIDVQMAPVQATTKTVPHRYSVQLNSLFAALTTHVNQVSLTARNPTLNALITLPLVLMEYALSQGLVQSE